MAIIVEQMVEVEVDLDDIGAASTTTPVVPSIVPPKNATTAKT